MNRKDSRADAKPPSLMARDLRVGDTYETGETALELEDIVAFARAFDPQPMHLDPAAAIGTFFGRIVASGWHVLALTMRLMVDAQPFGATPIIGVDLDHIRFRKPVLPGTRLRVRARIVELEFTTRPGRAFARVNVETLEAITGDVLVEQHWKLLLPDKR